MCCDCIAGSSAVHVGSGRVGLDVMGLCKGPTAGGCQMRDVLIMNEPGVLSGDFDHHLKLKVGDTQKMVFGDLDNFGNPETGPF